MPLSGAAGGSFSGDLVIGGRYTGEVKSRASGAGFKTLERWKGDHDVLFLRRDRQRPLVVLDFDLYAELVRDRANASLFCGQCGASFLGEVNP